MAVHVAYIRPMQIVGGNVVDKNDATIAQMMNASLEMRIMQDAAIASSTGNPNIKDYIEAEEAAGFRINHIDNNLIITYDTI